MAPWRLDLLSFLVLASFSLRPNEVGNGVCAGCHRNIARRYEATPMAKAASCETCHGPGRWHAKGSARMVVPSALEPGQRDSVCAPCHLKGDVQVNRAGKSASRFHPGDIFASYAATFVTDPLSSPKGHVDSLAASQCRRKSEALWCGSCHDVHDATVLPNACSQCHSTKNCGKGDQCITCHMPKLPGPVRTDHSIPRLPRPQTQATAPIRLIPFSPADSGDRELGLAYAELFRRTGNPEHAALADRLLKALPKPDSEARKWLNRKH